MEPVKVFISYAHKDELFKDELLVFLSPLIRKKDISLWNDRAMLVGDKWDSKIKEALLESQIIILLISPDFLASDYINDVELTLAIKLHQESELTIMPVLLRNSDISSHIIAGQENKISDFHSVPLNRIPVANWADRDSAWKHVVDQLKRVVDAKGTENS